jgi:fused signal recognition particle receptor
MVDIINKWKNSLTKTRNQTFGKIASLIGTSELSSDTWDELETLLLQSDLGTSVTQEVITTLRKKVDSAGIIKKSNLLQVLSAELRSRLKTSEILMPDQKPIVILIVGVNGSGKTTSIAKLGAYFKAKGSSIMFGAADTYRAAAVDQLKIWGSRLSIPVVSGQEDADPGSVVFDAVTAARAKNTDILLIDTAGRLHTRYNLMEELKKVYRVCGKAMEGSPHFVWLVLDATTGQNAFQQAKVFQQATNVDGIILAKLDSSAKGGMVFAIQDALNLPILFAGLGEKPEDFVPFDPENFVEGILESGL